MNRIILIVTLLAILLSSGCVKNQNETDQLHRQLSDMQQQISEKDIQIKSLTEENSRGYLFYKQQFEGLKNQTKFLCPSGYVLSTQWFEPTMEYVYYCKLDIIWTNFIPCTRSSDCGGAYGCYARGLNETDFRCAPSDNELLGECYCDTENGCSCA